MKDKLPGLPYVEPNFSKHLYYFTGYYLFHALIYLIVLSIIAFFHFLLDHRLADIQDWIFFQSWWILIFSKSTAFFVISRFTGILSFERKPLIHLLQYKKGIFRTEIYVAISIFLLGMALLGRPVWREEFEWELSSVLLNYIGVCLFFGLDGLLLLTLNDELPLKRKNWYIEIVLFSLMAFLFNKWTYFYGLNWSLEIVFFFILVFYCLRLRGGYVWLHSFLLILLMIAPLCALFGLGPLWKGLYSPFIFEKSIGGLEIGVFSVLTLIYFNSKRFKKIPL